MIVFGEAYLRRILGAYAAYYDESRIHRSLNKDTPFHRTIERLGAITSHPILGGLHHQYCRIQFLVHTGRFACAAMALAIVRLKARTLSPVVDRFIECAREVVKPFVR
jgi:hypothetical protein